jgi:hypothetical protein
MTAGDFPSLMVPVSRRLWGDPNQAASNGKELRWGQHGSRAVDVHKGTWYDHEACAGGGVLDLIARERGLRGKEAMAWLSSEGLLDSASARQNRASLRPMTTRTRRATSFSRCAAGSPRTSGSAGPPAMAGSGASTASDGCCTVFRNCARLWLTIARL